jgi:hypothetical protein
MKKPKVVTKYDSNDLAEIITNCFLNIESPEGSRFAALQVLPNVVTVRINNRTFLISVIDKNLLS